MTLDRRIGIVTLFLTLFSLAPPLLAAEPSRTLPKPHFSVKRGHLTGPFYLTLSSREPETTLLVTTDGSAPHPDHTKPAPPNSPVTLLLSTTTIVRAATFCPRTKNVSPTRTHSYLFRQSILQQKHPAWADQQLDFAIDPSLLGTPLAREKFTIALAAAPTISLSLPREALFGPEGLYPNPLEKGDRWEKPCSLEFIDPHRKNTSLTCGLQIHGSASRTGSTKLNFRLSFKAKFGPKKARAPFFPDSSVRSFDTLLLRNPTHDSWTISEAHRRQQARYLNDRWAAETQAAMGRPSPSHQWVHLFLNGFYWGLYDLSECPDEHFASSHFGGKDADYDVFNGNELHSGSWHRRKELTDFLIHSQLPEEERFHRLTQFLDLDSLADHLILNLYQNKTDWVSKNFWMIGRRSETPRFQFIDWDSEITLWETPRPPHPADSPSALHYNLLRSASFRRDSLGPAFFLRHLMEYPDFIDLFQKRLAKHSSPHGALHPIPASTRYRRLLDETEPLLLAESVRWGDTQEPISFGTHTSAWQTLTSPESWLFTEFFPKRSTILTRQLRDAGLAEAPEK